jgi:hypothetical protein
MTGSRGAFASNDSPTRHRWRRSSYSRTRSLRTAASRMLQVTRRRRAQPNVNAYTSTPGSTNWISKVRWDGCNVFLDVSVGPGRHRLSLRAPRYRPWSCRAPSTRRRNSSESAARKTFRTAARPVANRTVPMAARGRQFHARSAPTPRPRRNSSSCPNVSGIASSIPSMARSSASFDG